MILENTHLYKKEHQKQADEETMLHRKKSKTSATSRSRKRSDHKHIYKKLFYTTAVTHLLGDDNAKFAEEWILHIKLLIGVPKSLR